MKDQCKETYPLVKSSIFWPTCAMSSHGLALLPQEHIVLGQISWEILSRLERNACWDSGAGGSRWDPHTDGSYSVYYNVLKSSRSLGFCHCIHEVGSVLFVNYCEINFNR
ncbi:hypothetical protein AMECASPLE_008625 [Ameca splendens]|uniref:Uncharacterized protein n=1 Tax=Ameca splendens TaxID=208324 RepID=A0ABV0ZAL6_9TELE